MTDEQIATIERMWADGMSLKRIGMAVRLDKETVMNHICENRDRFPYRRARVDQCVKDEWARRIRHGESTVKDAAEATGASVSSVRRWVRGYKEPVSRVITFSDTDHTIGRCECGSCHWPIDPFDHYCRHCGARLESDEEDL